MSDPFGDDFGFENAPHTLQPVNVATTEEESSSALTTTKTDEEPTTASSSSNTDNNILLDVSDDDNHSQEETTTTAALLDSDIFSAPSFESSKQKEQQHNTDNNDDQLLPLPKEDDAIAGGDHQPLVQDEQAQRYPDLLDDDVYQKGGYNSAAGDGNEHFQLQNNILDESNDDNTKVPVNDNGAWINGRKTPEETPIPTNNLDTALPEDPLDCNGGVQASTANANNITIDGNPNTDSLPGKEDGNFSSYDDASQGKVIEDITGSDEVSPPAQFPADFNETNEATPPPSPQSTDPADEQPEPVNIYTPLADTTTPADVPVKMPKATTISAPTKANRSNSAGGVAACMKMLDPRVCDVLLWREPKVTAPILTAMLVLLLALGRCTVFSVVSNLLLIVLVLTFFARIGKVALSKVHTVEEDHPFKDVLEADILLSEDVAADYAQKLVRRLNPVLLNVRNWALVKEYGNSIKFALVLYACTWFGACINGLTVIILATVAAFTVPKVYEVNKSQIDEYVDIGQAKFDDLYKQLQEKIPYLKKQKIQ